jgi:hypothetical protein
MAMVLVVGAGSVLAVIIPPGTKDSFEEVTTTSAALPSTATLAETFTVQTTGTLNGFGVYLGSQVIPQAVKVGPAAPGDAQVGVVGVIAGVPGSNFLGGGAISTNVDGAGWYYYSLGTPIGVTAGFVYAIVVAPSDAADTYSWAGDCSADAGAVGAVEAWIKPNGGSYGSMAAWGVGPGDNVNACQLNFAFRTYVTAGKVPPPTATVEPAGGSGNPAPSQLLLISLATAAAFVTVRKVAALRR